MRLWRVGFVVWTRSGTKSPKENNRILLVMAEDDDKAEEQARTKVTEFAFGQKVVAIEWRSTASMPPIFDLSQWAADQQGGRT